MENRKNLEIVTELLNKDVFRNVNILNFIEINEITYLEKIGESALVKGVSDREWIYISNSNADELKTIKTKLTEEDKNFAAIEEWMLPILNEEQKIDWQLPTVQYYLPEFIQIEKPNFATKSLSYNDASTIFENSEYKDFINIEYIQSRIENDISVGIYDTDRLVAWGLIQDDGAMGFLHVLSEYRRKGNGLQVTLALIKKIRKAGKLPFACIVQDNHKSINLVKKLGFVEDKKKIWFGLK